MNKVILLGRISRDIESRSTEDGKTVARFGIAVNRRFKNSEGTYDADFINCVAFGNTADFIAKYFSKGSMIAIVGWWRTGSYTNNDGVKIYTNEISIDEAYFAGSKSENSTPTISEENTSSSDTNIGIESFPNASLENDDLPF